MENNQNTRENNTRIAKNTLMLYARMILLMVISLYTSRVILDTLGIEDYGINNVVAGVITMLSFITGSMSCAVTRFLTVAIGEGDPENSKKIFGSLLLIQVILAAIIVVFGETFGLCFVMNKLVIPENRMVAAMWVYQFSILSSVIGVLMVPYNAAIIAHEKMKAFAYISIFDTVLKLVIVYMLVISPIDKLITYAVLFFCISCVDQIIYFTYCAKNFNETRTNLVYEPKKFKEIFGFSGWVVTGYLAIFGATQGLNILLNMFFGAAINAARGVAVQVQTIALSFGRNFQTALNPQLIKSYASGNYEYSYTLLNASTKYTYFMLLFICLPLMLEAPLVLDWWLVDVPDSTVIFLRLILCSSIVAAISSPTSVVVNATGKIKKFQICEASTYLLILPISYIALKFFHVSPPMVFVISLLIEIVTQIVRVSVVMPQIKMPVKLYLTDSIIPILLVTVVSVIVPLVLYYFLNQSVLTFFIICTSCVISVSLSIYVLGLKLNERQMVNGYIKKLLRTNK